MYCSSCGGVVTQGLSYCKFCGAKLSGTKGDDFIGSSQPRPESLVFAMMAIFVFGLGAIAVLMGVMKVILGLPVERVLAFTVIPFLLMLLLEGVFIRLLMRRKRGTEEAGDRVLSRGQATNELDAAQARALPQPVPSVTEHTTRAFEPIYNERTSK
jgi:hypothetical protein